MQTGDNVARWFLAGNAVAVLTAGGEFISNSKLQRLLYYAQGLHLALHDSQLFAEPILAGSYGGVVQSVYDKYSANGVDGIKDFEPPIKNFNEQEEATLQFAQENFGQFSSWKLSRMNCEETPYKDTPRNEIISLDKLKNYFLEHYVEEACVHDVAKYILGKTKKMSKYKLNFLCFYSLAFHYIRTGKYLFKEKFYLKLKSNAIGRPTCYELIEPLENHFVIKSEMVDGDTGMLSSDEKKSIAVALSYYGDNAPFVLLGEVEEHLGEWRDGGGALLEDGTIPLESFGKYLEQKIEKI